jgi:hypothetical protein
VLVVPVGFPFSFKADEQEVGLASNPGGLAAAFGGKLCAAPGMAPQYIGGLQLWMAGSNRAFARPLPYVKVRQGSGVLCGLTGRPSEIPMDEGGRSNEERVQLTDTFYLEAFPLGWLFSPVCGWIQGPGEPSGLPQGGGSGL